MKITSLKRLSYIYLILPIIIFMLGWVKLKYSIPIIITIIVITTKIYNEFKKDEERILTITGASILFVFFIILCVFGGHGGMFYQTPDWNEIF